MSPSTPTCLALLVLASTPWTASGAAQERGARPRAGATPGAPATERLRDQETPAKPAGVPREELTTEERAAQWFQIADYDADGWITYFEAQKSLSLDRPGFATYDKDRDGRITPDEYLRRHESLLSQGGVLAPPVPKPEKARPPRRDPATLLQLFDQTPDQGLDLGELRKLLEDYGVEDPSARVLHASLDRDASRRLEGGELDALLEILTPTERTSAAKPRERVTTIAALFGKVEPRERVEGRLPQLPDRLPGPVSSFRRLDLDDDGGIELDDLQKLLRPVQTHVRPNAVFALLDVDGDGRVSQTEWARSMAPRRP